MSRVRPGLILIAAVSLAALSTQIAPIRSSAAAEAIPRPATSVAETSPVTQFADQVTTLGITRFPETFTSATLTNATTVTVYATADNAALRTAIAALPARGVHVDVHVVSHSFQQLNDLAQRIGNDGAVLRSAQVDISSVRFDAAHGKLAITLVRPMGAMAAGAITSMVDNARSRLDARYGMAWISLAATTEPVAIGTASRDSDGAPWTGGDGIHLSGFNDGCTLGFTTKGNNSGNEYLLTAGHCGTGTVTQGSSTVGSVSTQYFGGSHHYDVDTIRANGRARVWYNGHGTTGNYVVTGSIIPANGTAMTVDGDVNPPQHTGITVSNNETFQYLNFDHYGEVYIGPLVQLSTGACVHGDSGGPAYVRSGSTGNIKAVGTISGTNSNTCWVFWINAALSAANLSLVTG
jgi:hypothetical protein